MANDILEVPQTTQALACTQTSLGAGAGRNCTKVAIANYPRIKLEGWFQFTSAPTAGKVVKVYALFHNGSFNTEGITGTDAAVATEPKNAMLVATISVKAATTAQYWRGEIEHPGAGYFSIVVWNGADAAFDSTAGHHVAQYTFENEQVQAGS